MRTDFSPRAASARDFYRLLTAVVVPRPIAWVSSVSPEGVDNLAPHSFFTVASTNPPIVQFTSVGEKDSLRNIIASEEFVVNLAPGTLLPTSRRTSASSTPPG
jgi:flavin reductase (DIM6/NTAB) family NADH-FMN oxidoreductase RutF